MLTRQRLGWKVARLFIVCLCLYASGRIYYKSYRPALSKPGPINAGPDATTRLGRSVHANKEVVAEESTFGTLVTAGKTYIDTELDEEPGPIDELDLQGENYKYEDNESEQDENVSETDVVNKESTIAALYKVTDTENRKEAEYTELDNSPMTNHIHVSVSMTKADRQVARQVVDMNSLAQHHYTQLSMFFTPILDTTMWRDLEEEFDAIVATLWNFLFSTTKPIYSRKNITQINREPQATCNNKLDLRKTIDCSNMHRLQIRGMAGKGSYKFVYMADYLGVPVVVKVSKEHLYREMGHRFASYIRSNAAMLQEIFMAKIIAHPIIQKPRGYCIHDGMNVSGVFMRPGVTAVYDFGTIINLQNTPWQERLRHAVAVADLLRYADNSPLGRLLLGDFKPRQFFMVSNQIVMSDTQKFERLDEENCHINKSHHDLHETTYNISDCRYNMFAAYETFFSHLLQPEFYPNNLTTVISELRERIQQYSVNATQLYEALSTLYHEGTK